MKFWDLECYLLKKQEHSVTHLVDVFFPSLPGLSLQAQKPLKDCSYEAAKEAAATAKEWTALPSGCCGATVLGRLQNHQKDLNLWCWKKSGMVSWVRSF